MISARVRSLLFGALLPYHALRLILARRTLLLWSAFPLGVTFVLYAWLMRSLERWVDEKIRQVLASVHLNPSGFAGVTIAILASVVTFVFCAVTFSLGATVVSSPFNDRLAESTEPWTQPPLARSPHPRSLGRRVRLIAIDFVKSVCALVATLLALLVSWIPGLNLLALAFLFLLVTFQYISYPQTRRGQGLGAGLAFLLRHPWSSLAFGGVISALFAIPLVSCLVIPLAVVGGTLLVARAQPGATGEFPLH